MTNGSSRPDLFCKKVFLQNFTKFTGKHLCQSLFFNQVAGLRPATFFKKRLWHRCFSMNFVKLKNTYFYRTPPITASVQNFVSISNQIEVGLCSNRGEEVFSKVFASEEHHLYLSLSKTMVMVVLIILVPIVWLILSVWTFLHFIELLPETFEFHFCNELLFPP